MRICHALEQFSPPPNGVVLSIGNFDGAHRGHARLVQTVRGVADRLRATPVVMTFEPHPIEVLAPERTPPRLTTLSERLALLARLQIGDAIVLRSEPELLAMEAEDFLATLVAHVQPRAFVEGPDFHFGRGRRGTNDTLRVHAAHWGYEVHEVPAERCRELTTEPTISSSSIRQALRDGRVQDANVMLGRAYRIVGTVGHGEGRGADLGFPTANLEQIVHMLPQEAVYAAAAQLEDGTLHLAAVNVGPQPTFGQTQSRVEAFVLDLKRDLRGRRVGLHFLSRLRDQVRFPDVNALVQQLRADVEQTRAWQTELGCSERMLVIEL